MSEELFRDPATGLEISTYAGPKQTDNGPRKRFQVYAPGRVTYFTMEEWMVLAEWFSRDCSPECEGPHLDITWDRRPETRGLAPVSISGK
jgi:hypothetical protein